MISRLLMSCDRILIKLQLTGKSRLIFQLYRTLSKSPENESTIKVKIKKLKKKKQTSPETFSHSRSLESCCISAFIWNHVVRSVVHSAIQDHARSKHKLTGGVGGSNDWPTLTPPPGIGPSVKAYFLVHFRSLHLSTIPFVLMSNFPFVFHSTPQARSQQETENFLKLPLVNDISGVLYLVDPMWILPPRMWEELQF